MADYLQVTNTLLVVLTIITFLSFFCNSVWRRASTFQSLQRKHVFITGGSSGIGLEIAKEALSQGSYVTLVSRNLSNLRKAVEGIIQEVECDENKINIKVADVSDYKAISAAVTQSFEWKPIDILVCNAGIAHSSFLDEVPVKEIDLTIGTNLTGTMYMLRVALPLMKQRSNMNPSTVVLMGSLSSLYLLYGHGLYTATKYAIRGLAEALRLELLPYNIGVTHVCPGYVETPMLREIEDSIDARLADVVEKVCFYNRNQRVHPREVAKATLQAAKQGRFLVTSGFMGFIPATLSRGLIPAESFGRAVMELVAIFPCRLISFIVSGYIRGVILWHHQKMNRLVNDSKAVEGSAET
eukprot:PITA_34726